MSTWIGLLALAGGGALAWHGHKQINRLDNQFFIMHQAIQQMPGALEYRARFANPGQLPR